LNEVGEQTHETDVLVVGSEGAGARAAIEAARNGARTILATKSKFARSGATITAGTDIDIDSRSICDLLGLPGDTRDTPEIFFEDIILEGKYLNDQRMVEIHVKEGPIRVKELVDWGMKVWGPQRAAGHRYNRGVLSSGLYVMRGLRNELAKHKDKVSLLENLMMTDLLTAQGRICGAVGVDLRKGEFVVIRAKSVILATGGGQRVYPYSTAPEGLTGDGHAMAYRIGAEFLDMQFVQFLTSTFVYPPVTTHSINPLLMRGAWLLNTYGERFMFRWDREKGEATTRDYVAIGIMNEILEGRGWGDDKGSWVMLSMKHLPDNYIDEIANRGAELLSSGLAKVVGKQFFDNMKRNSIPAFPASHFFCGGVRVDIDGKSSIPGLYAAGEVSGGLNGSNRISGNAITQILVQGARAGRAAAEYSQQVASIQPESEQLMLAKERVLTPLHRDDGIDAIMLKKRLQKVALEKAGVVRDATGLQEAIRLVQDLRKGSSQIRVKDKNPVFNVEWIEALQLESMLTVLEMITKSALMRTESRGVHFRRDFPSTDDSEWLKHIILKKVDENMVIETQPVIMTRMRPGQEEVSLAAR
jgi:succinate dehydrogenase/fumarate reductase flavoprotein subunit